jgi:cell division protein FtsZ
MPFTVEGKKRMAQAEQGLAELRGCVDTIITIPNSKLKEVEEKISIMDAFRRADDVLLQAVQGISDLITTSGIINLDFADVRAVMKGRGVALMGIGEAKGEGAAVKAMKSAIDSKLLEENSIKGAKGALINITSSKNTALNEIEDAIALIESEAHDEADIIWGTVFNDEMGDEVKITVIATGFDTERFSVMPSGGHQSETTQAVGQFSVRTGFAPSEREEDLNVPTFIRRQAD